MFIKAMRQGEPATTLFRLTDLEGNYTWLKAEGKSEPGDKSHFYGYIQDVSQDASLIIRLHSKESGDVDSVSHRDHPKKNALISPDGRPTTGSEQFASSLLEGCSASLDIMEILEIMTNHQHPNLKFDGLLFSETLPQKEYIQVYAKGLPFKPPLSGTKFPYQGSLSETIAKKNLTYFIMNDTMSSTRPIDWALFIPYGIQSYLALPFYVRKILKNLLVFCSTSPDFFSVKDIESSHVYIPAFKLGLKNWKKFPRTSKPPSKKGTQTS